MKTIREAFTLKQIEEAVALGQDQTKGMVMDLIGHIQHLPGVEVDKLNDGWIIKSITAVRTKYHLIQKGKIKTDVLWHDGSADTETNVHELDAKRILRLFSVLEIVHAA